MCAAPCGPFRQNVPDPFFKHMWRRLDRHSTVASRLYEFLLLRFYRTPVLHISYKTLAQFLPVRPEKFLSHARKQLDAAFDLVSRHRIIERITWVSAKNRVATLHIHRGERLTPPLGRVYAAPALLDDDLTSDLRVKELHGLKPTEWSIVADFYRFEKGVRYILPERPGGCCAQNVPDPFFKSAKAKALIPLAVRNMQTKWRDAKTFGAVTRYIPEATAEFDKQQRHIELRRAEQLQRQRETEEAERKRRAREQIEATWQPAWDRLPPSEQHDIREAVLSKNRHVQKIPKLLHRLCLDELARRYAPQGVPA